MTHKPQLILAHGAGAGKDSPFMQQMDNLLELRGVTVHRFNFPYMQRAIEENRKRPPNGMKQLIATFEQQLAQFDQGQPLFVGGKSMGARVALSVMAHCNVAGAVALGYPLHPPGKPEKLRLEPLEQASKPVLIVQGERDTFGNQTEWSAMTLNPTIDLLFLPDGDHSLKPRKRSGYDYDDHLARAATAIADFIYQTGEVKS